MNSENSVGCVKCGEVATLLCDGRLPRWLMKRQRDVSKILQKDYPGKLLSDFPYATCDRPLCENCAQQEDPIFWKYKDGTEVTVNDYCPLCASYNFNIWAKRHSLKKQD